MLSKKIKVSVIIPVFNGEKFIGKAVESVLNQTFHDYEIIIVDDASTDSTSLILKEYNDNDKIAICYR